MLRSIFTAYTVLTSFLVFGSDIIPSLENIQIHSYEHESENHSFALTGSGTISGYVYTHFGHPVKNVKIKLKSHQTGFPKSKKTNSQGKYEFKHLNFGYNYQICPSKKGDELNGVNFYDVFLLYNLLRRHSTDLSPYFSIAADINNDETINANDLVALLSVLFRKTHEFPNNCSWRFVDADFNFIDESNPWPFVEDIQVISLDNNSIDNNFVAIKIGDLSGNTKPYLKDDAETRNLALKSLESKDFFVEKNKQYTIKLDINETKTIKGMQLFFDQSNMTIVDISTPLFNADASYTYVTESTYKTMWYDRNQLVEQNQSAFLNVTFIPKKNGLLSDLLKLDNSDHISELYTGDQELSGQYIELAFEHFELGISNLDVIQNYPNPFANQTTVEFMINKPGQVKFTIFDINGAEIYKSSINGHKGKNTLTVSAEDLGSNGIFHYQLTFGKSTETKTMIVSR